MDIKQFLITSSIALGLNMGSAALAYDKVSDAETARTEKETNILDSASQPKLEAASSEASELNNGASA